MRFLRTLLVVLLLLVLVVGAVAWWQSSSLAEKLIRSELAKLNIPVESLSVTAVTPHSIILSNLALGEGGALHAQSATVHFDYDLKTRKLGAFDATIDGAEMRGQLANGNLLLGGIEKAWSTALVTPTKDAIAMALNGSLKVARDVGGHYKAQLDDGLLTLSQNQKNMLLPLTVAATGEGDLSALKAQGNFHDARNNVKGTFAADYSVAKKTGKITWQTAPMDFAESGFTFAQLSPGFAEGVSTIASKLSISGVVDLKPGQWTVTPDIMLLELPVDTLLTKALGEGTSVHGNVKGELPIRISKGGVWRIEKSRLINIGPMSIKLDPKAAALDVNAQTKLAKSALSNFEVETLTLDVASTDNKGGVALDWHFVGKNPDFMGGKPVDLTLAVTMNLSDMWRSLQEVTRATKAAEQLLLRKK